MSIQKFSSNGDVGLFIPVPEELAKEFPSREPRDSSPPHITFLIVGNVPEHRRQEFLDLVQDVIWDHQWNEVSARLGHLDYFDNAYDEVTVAHLAVSFSHPMSELRERIWRALVDAKFEVDDTFWTWRPHVTFRYLETLGQRLKGEVPTGDWNFNEIEVWGLPGEPKLTIAPTVQEVSIMVARKHAALSLVKGPQLRIGGRSYALSPLSHTSRTPSSRYSYLWVYLEGHSYPLLMWRVSDGDFKLSGNEREYRRTIEELKSRGELNIISRRELAQIEQFMGKREEEAFQALKSWGKELETDYQKQVNEVTRSFYDRVVKPNLDKIRRDVESGVIPLGFKRNPRIPRSEKEQKELFAISKLLNNIDEQQVERWATKAGFKVDSQEDIQAFHWAWEEIKDEVFDRFRGRRASVTALRVAARFVESAQHDKNIALMRWLSGATKKLGVARDTYVVGGAVRNFLIDRPIKDIDIVIDSVNAGKNSDWLANQLSNLIPTEVDVTTNQYGVAILTVKGPWNLDGHEVQGEVIEIANARSESYGGEAGKGYKPSEVQPATIQEDVLRREFTFNSLLWRLLDLAPGPEKAEIIDLTGCGKRDLENRVLQCPREPDVVFSDDPTRMLRAIKFTGKYGFKIPPDVKTSIKKNAPKMKRMPWNAIGTILVDNILSEPTARASLVQMKELGLLDVIAEMVQDSKPFASYLEGQLQRDRRVQFLLDLMDLGLPARTPISFLDKRDQQRLREITIAMEQGEASAFANKLIKPPVDNRKVFQELNLEGKQRGIIKPTARKLILENPALANQPNRLTRAVIERLSR